MRHVRPLLASFVALSAIGLSTLGCGDSAGSGAGGSASTSNTSTGTGMNNGVCILHNCDSSAECEGCSDGRTSCDVASHRCVACGVDGKACPNGQKCSSFGICVDPNLECPTDAQGVPTNACASNGDCLACDPAHQVCDPATQQCVACTQTDTSECEPTDICKAGKCQNKCAPGCLADNDCGQCTGAKACNNHKCSQCSATYACPSGFQCSANGTCEQVCGKPTAPGVCTTSTDCAGCGEVGYTCKTPINGGDGVCIPPATGCSDLGQGALALPAPWNQVTQTCSNMTDCSNVSIQFNVGKALRDLTGLDATKIQDANLTYPMSTCASIEIANTSCGLCVPCREDADCSDVDIDAMSSQLFPGVSGILVKVLLNQIFGAQAHKIYMYCQNVTAGYGVCAPCPGLLSDCGSASPTMACPSGVSQTAQCCGDVCASDPYCCSTSWDSVCDNEAATICGGNPCPHDPCTTGDKLATSCGACAVTVCGLDAYCCSTSWDSQCVQEATSNCSGGCP